MEVNERFRCFEAGRIKKMKKRFSKTPKFPCGKLIHSLTSLLIAVKFNLVITFQSVDEVLKCSHSNKSFRDSVNREHPN